MPNSALNLASFSRWTLRDKAAQRLLALRWASLMSRKLCTTSRKFRLLPKSGTWLAADCAALLACSAEPGHAYLER